MKSCAGALWSITSATAGKISVTPTKGLLNQRDLALAYTPGVAAACEEIIATQKRSERKRMNLREVGKINR